jgi:Flp pilus assembly protein CpaB
VQNIRRGSDINPDMVALYPWPEEALFQGALRGEEGLAEVIGQRARTDIAAEQPILDSMVVPNLSDLASVGSDLAALLPVGTRAVAVPVDRLTTVAYGIQPGDRVDIIVSMLFLDIDEEFQSQLPNSVTLINITRDEESGTITLSPGGQVDGRFESIPLPPNPANQTSWPAVLGPSEQPRPRLLTQLTIQDALVMGLGNFPRNGRLFGEPTPLPIVTDEEQLDQATTQDVEQAAQANSQALDTIESELIRPDIITLAVTPQDAVMLTYLVEARVPITFALRAATDTSAAPTVPVTLQYILDTYNIEPPELLDVSIEPAIRSIRQLLAGQQITLGSDPLSGQTP